VSGPLFRVGCQLCLRRTALSPPPKPQTTVRTQKLFLGGEASLSFDFTWSIKHLGQKKFWLSVSSHVIKILSSSPNHLTQHILYLSHQKLNNGPIGKISPPTTDHRGSDHLLHCGEDVGMSEKTLFHMPNQAKFSPLRKTRGRK